MEIENLTAKELEVIQILIEKQKDQAEYELIMTDSFQQRKWAEEDKKELVEINRKINNTWGKF